MTGKTKTKLALVFVTLVILLFCLAVLYVALLIAGNWGGIAAFPLCWVIVATSQVVLEAWGKDLNE